MGIVPYFNSIRWYVSLMVRREPVYICEYFPSELCLGRTKMRQRRSTGRWNHSCRSLPSQQHSPLLFLMTYPPSSFLLLNDFASLLRCRGEDVENTSNFLYALYLDGNDRVPGTCSITNYHYVWQLMVYHRDIAHQCVKRAIWSYVVNSVNQS